MLNLMLSILNWTNTCRDLTVDRRYEPYSKLRDLLPIVWLWHRYEVEVASKTIGGVQYQHVVKGGANAAAGRSTPTEARMQWASLRALLRSVQPNSLTMSQRLIDSVRPPLTNPGTSHVSLVLAVAVVNDKTDV